MYKYEIVGREREKKIIKERIWEKNYRKEKGNREREKKKTKKIERERDKM